MEAWQRWLQTEERHVSGGSNLANSRDAGEEKRVERKKRASGGECETLLETNLADITMT